MTYQSISQEEAAQKDGLSGRYILIGLQDGFELVFKGQRPILHLQGGVIFRNAFRTGRKADQTGLDRIHVGKITHFFPQSQPVAVPRRVFKDFLYICHMIEYRQIDLGEWTLVGEGYNGQAFISAAHPGVLLKLVRREMGAAHKVEQEFRAAQAAAEAEAAAAAEAEKAPTVVSSEYFPPCDGHKDGYTVITYSDGTEQIVEGKA